MLRRHGVSVWGDGKVLEIALVGVAQLVGASSHNQKAAGLSPGRRLDPPLGHVQEAANWCFSR